MKYKINGTLLTFVTALWRCLQPLSKRSTTNGHRRYNGGYFCSERSQKVPEISNKTRMVGSLHKSPGDVSGLRSRPFAFFLAFRCNGVQQLNGNLVHLQLFQQMTAQLGNIDCQALLLLVKSKVCTGKSLSEAILFAEHGENMLCTEIVLNVKNNFCAQSILPWF